MKKVLMLFVAVAVVAGCATMTPDRVAFNSVQSIQAGATSSMRVIGNLYKQQRTFDANGNVTAVLVPTPQVTDADKARAEALYGKIQAGCKAVVASLETITTAQQATDLTKPLQDLANSLAAFLVQLQTGGAK